MIISDALPIQFWLNGEPTFNENIEAGVEHTPFYQKFNADDNIVLQFTDTVERSYKLSIFDEDGELLVVLDFEVTEDSGVFTYSIEYTFEDQDIEGLVRLQISYYSYTFDLEGGVTDLIEDVEGEMTFVPEELLFSIEGDVADLLEEVSGGVTTLTLIGLTNNSLDIVITDVLVNGVSAQFVSGSMPCGTGSGANLATKQNGVLDIVVVYTSSVPDQHITLTDSDSNVFCQPNAAPPNTYSGCVVTQGLNIGIDAADGVCP